jgi:nicotinamide-nucleotide amidase
VGLVYIAVARPEGDVMTREYRFGDIGRDRVRLASVEKALMLLADSF